LSTIHLLTFRKKISQIKGANVSNFNKLAENFKGRILEKDGKLYLIEDINLFDNEAKILQLYDSNGLRVDTNLYSTRKMFYSISLLGLSENNFMIYSYDKSEILKTQLNTDNSKIIKIWFSMREGGSIPHRDGFVFSRIAGKVFTPERVSPEGIDLSHYDIVNDANQVIEVRNKNDNLRVMFTYEEIKSEWDSLPVTLHIYYSFYKKMFNVLHLHSLDDTMRLDKGYDVVSIDRDDNAETQKETENLKIIFKGLKVAKVYKRDHEKGEVKEIKFLDFNFKTERIIKIKSENSYLNGFFGKIKKIPVYQLSYMDGQDSLMTADEDTQPDFETNDICFKTNISEGLSGLVDISICFDQNGNFIDDINVSFPVCMLEFLPSMNEMNLEQKYLKEAAKRNSDEIQGLDKIYKDVSENFEKYLGGTETLPISAYNTIQEYRLVTAKIMKYVETNELWAYIQVNRKF
jgi:hypothetical protein